jgi:hypothetical protein
MSIRLMTRVWDDAPYEGARLLVLLAMADTAHDDGSFFVSQAHLAGKARCSTEYVRLSVKQFIDDGYVTVTAKGNHRGKATEYVLHPPTQVVPNSVGEGSSGTPLPNSDGENSPTLTGSLPNSIEQHSSYTPVLTPVLLTSDVPPDTAQVAVVEGVDKREARRLATLLADLIEGNGSKRPNVTETWVKDIRLMIQRDGRSPDSIEKAIRWCQADDFWRANIGSPSKLRAKYDQMRLQAARRPTGRDSQQAAVADEAALTGRPVEDVRAEHLATIAATAALASRRTR